MPHGIIELLTLVEEEKIRLQFLDNSISNISQKRKGGGASVTFSTDQITPGEVLNGNSAMVGVIVWIPRADVDRINAKWDKEKSRG